ncbi:hypothetical protein EAF00_002487 [Botryotinia globosa]|nr:hypothetical protein EAF00_002487 [Botryotinia globosa]
MLWLMKGSYLVLIEQIVTSNTSGWQQRKGFNLWNRDNATGSIPLEKVMVVVCRKMGERWEKDGRKMGERWEKDGRKMGDEYNHPTLPGVDEVFISSDDDIIKTRKRCEGLCASVWSILINSNYLQFKSLLEIMIG